MNPINLNPSCPTVCIQGLGFVGAAMCAAVAQARDEKGELRYNVVGIDLNNDAGRQRIDALNAGRFPFETTDAKLRDVIAALPGQGNFIATSDASFYAEASVVVADIPFDIDWQSEPPALRPEGFEAAMRQLASTVSAGCLVLVETTVPPGTTEKLVFPLFAEVLQERGMKETEVHLAHSYERVMPGPHYLESITHFWRVYAGMTDAAAEAAEAFLASIIDTEQFPLTRLPSPTASETGKVMENSYRATTIAFMEEWGQFAEEVGIDLFPVVEAIRMRPTHSNMRTPGFGVGGYCITKDPLFAQLGAKAWYGKDLDFPFCRQAVRTNQFTPLRSVERIEAALGGTLEKKRILLMGVSYRSDVGDARYSPSETFAREVLKRGAVLFAHDPLLSRWDELDCDILQELPDLSDVDAVVLAVAHPQYKNLDWPTWLGENRPVILDGFNILSEHHRKILDQSGCTVLSIGRGDQVMGEG